MQKELKISFDHFLEIFPEIDLPITLSDDSAIEFSKKNDPIPALMIGQFIDAEQDDFTEYIACLRISKTDDFHAIIYWKAALLSYQYVLATYTKNGQLIDKSVIAGTYSDGKSLTKSVATIDEDWIIYIVSGQTAADAPTYDPSTSNAFNLELLATGEIITNT
jgi:hypothetical protein